MRTRERGSILIITLLVLGALTILGLATITLSGMDGEVAVNQRAGDQALYVAEAGIALGINEVNNNLALVNAPGTQLPVHNLTNGGAVSLPGLATVPVNVFVGPAPNAQNSSVHCGLVGFSDKFGSVRFRVESTGTAGGGASRSVQAVVQLPPQEGLCTPGVNTGSCGKYAGGC
jgi:hypothetical protein